MPPPPQHPPLPKAAAPKYSRVFDPWNSVALGHQRAESRGPKDWRTTRTHKLQSQLGGEDNNNNTSGQDDDDDQQQQTTSTTTSVIEMLRRPGTMQSEKQNPKKQQQQQQQQTTTTTNSSSKQLFAGLVVYINGSTHPLVSDHALKKLLVEHGARLAIHLGRRQVTHVILGTPSAAATAAAGGASRGAGGGLAGGKLEREIRRVGGCGVKYVGVEWVLESLKAGCRLPEARFANVKVASQRQPSVYGAFSGATKR